MDAFEAQYDQAFGPEAGLSPRNLVDPKQLEVRTPRLPTAFSYERPHQVGLLLLALINRLTRKRVIVFFDCELVAYFVFLELISDILRNGFLFLPTVST